MKNKLPPYVYPRPRRSAYCYRPYVKGKASRPEYKLCSIDASMSEIWEAYENQLKENQPTGKDTIRWLLKTYIESDSFKEKGLKTQKNQLYLVNTICQHKTSNGKVGDKQLSKVTAGFWTVFMESLKAQGKTPTANNCRSFLNVAWCWAYARDKAPIPSPIQHSIKFKTQVRDRYVTDAEYTAVYNQAENMVQRAMELAYLCRLRSIEVLEMKQDQLLDEGILCRRRKGSKDNIAIWNDRLRKAVKPQAQSEYVVHYRSGKQLQHRELNKRFLQALRASGVDHFTFHDLKAKGISDTKAELRKGAGGHRSDSAAQVYDRSIDRYQPAAS